MALSKSNKTFVNAIFQSAVKSIQESNYDLRGFTKSKVEVGLTALLATGLMASAPNFHAYVEVPTSESIGTGLEDIRTNRDFKRKKEQTRSDLIVLNRHSPNWEKPEFYLEFKFKQNYDLKWFNLEPKKEEREITLVNNYVENLGDLKKLSQFKESHQETICLQGFYILILSQRNTKRRWEHLKVISLGLLEITPSPSYEPQITKYFLSLFQEVPTKEYFLGENHSKMRISRPAKLNFVETFLLHRKRISGSA